MHFDPQPQFFCLSVLTGVYFAGLLLKTQAMSQGGGIGVMLVVMLVAVIVAAFVLAITEFRTGLKHLRKVLHSFDILYPGYIPPVKGLDCVASFPGKFSKGWDKVRRENKLVCIVIQSITNCHLCIYTGGEAWR